MSTVAPPTYPARPVNGGPLEQALKYPRPGRWLYEPKLNGWRALVHAPTGTMFNRKGERLSIAGEFKRALSILQHSPFDWLDCEALERRHTIGKGTLVILDIVELGDYDTRRTLMGDTFCRSDLRVNYLGSPDDCQPDSVFLLPYQPPEPREKLLQYWEQMQMVNARHGCQFYEGVVAKRADSLYPMQLRSPNEEFSGWVKHRWHF